MFNYVQGQDPLSSNLVDVSFGDGLAQAMKNDGRTVRARAAKRADNSVPVIAGAEVASFVEGMLLR